MLIECHEVNLIPELVASRSIELYNSLPRHGKPQIRSNGVPEWTILATICLVKPKLKSSTNDVEKHQSEALNVDVDHADGAYDVIPVSLGTGMKCLPANKLPPVGDTLHDCHAEILARRGFVRWSIAQASARSSVSAQDEDHLLRWDEEGKRFKLAPGVQIWLYLSSLPCGDASTLHTAAHQPPEMAALKGSADGNKAAHVPGTAVRGRNGYEAFGAIRTKPGRADSTPSISFSCSDKIATWSALGLQGGLLADSFEPLYLEGIVVGGVDDPPDASIWGEGLRWRDKIKAEVERAIWGRLSDIRDQLPSPYSLHRPKVYLTSIPFPHSKTQVQSVHGLEPAPMVTSLLHLPWHSASSEVLYNGSVGGSWKSPGTQPLLPRYRSKICKSELFGAHQDLVDSLQREPIHDGLETRRAATSTYYQVKHVNSAYQTAKEVLRGVPRPAGDASSKDFSSVGSFEVTQSAEDDIPAPFRGWIVSGRRYESFTAGAEYVPGSDLGQVKEHASYG